MAFSGVAFDDVNEVLACFAGFFRLAIHLFYVVCNGFGERLHEIARAQHVVRRNAGLACVHALAPGDFLGGVCNLHIVEDDYGRLAAKFERDSGVDFCGAFRDMRADLRATRKEHVVEGKSEQLVSDFRSSALHDGDLVLLEHTCDKRFEKRGYMRSLVARFRDDDVPCGNGCGDGGDEQQEGVVPRRHDEHTALRFEVAHAPVQREQPTPAPGLVFHPVGEACNRVVDFFEGREHFGQPGFGLRLVEVRPHGVVEFLLALYNRLAESLQFRDAFLRGRVGDLPALFALRLEKAVQFFDDHTLPTSYRSLAKQGKCIYSLFPTFVIPQHRRCKRVTSPDRMF